MKLKIIVAVISIFSLLGVGLAVDNVLEKPEKTKITTSDKIHYPVNRTSKFVTTIGKEAMLSVPKQIVVSYESKPLAVAGRPNAAVLEWDQTQGVNATVEVRTEGNDGWSAWVPANQNDGGKDNTEANAISSSLVLAASIHKIQYRLRATASDDNATINLQSTTLQSIDSKTGPSAYTPLYKQVLGFINPTAHAEILNGPSIISRQDWGCPESSSSEWTPEYHDLKRAIVHHTATTEPSDTYATVRAIWQYHTKSLGWGDIGYNYLVDYSGKIFQGRYFDQEYAKEHRVDVVGGHAYNNNVSTTGISAIGTYTSIRPTDAMLNSISNIIAYKLAPYSVDPRGDSGFGPGTGGAVIGHREVYQTTCPGDAMFSQIQQIKDMAYPAYQNYNQQYLYDYQHVNTVFMKDSQSVPIGTALSPSDNVSVKLYLKNIGKSTWSNSSSPVILGTNAPQNRSSELYTDGWISPNRLSSFSRKQLSDGSEVAASSIAPSETGIFEFPVKVPTIIAKGSTSPPIITEYIKPLIEYVAWFPHDIGMSFPVTVAPVTYDYAIESQSTFTNNELTKLATTPLSPDTDYYLTIALINTGTATWEKSTFHLGTASPYDRISSVRTSDWLSGNRLPAMQEDSVKPGEVAHFVAKIHTGTPSSATNSREYVLPVADGITWLTDTGIYWDTSTEATRYGWQILEQDLYADSAHSTSVSGTNLVRGKSYYATLKIKNTGNVPWQRYAFNLGTSNPRDRSSTFYDKLTWPSPNRAATLTESVVNPGETGTFEFTFSTESSSQSTKEYFTPVFEGRTWMTDYGLYWDMRIA